MSAKLGQDCFEAVASGVKLEQFMEVEKASIGRSVQLCVCYIRTSDRNEKSLHVQTSFRSGIGTGQFAVTAEHKTEE